MRGLAWVFALTAGFGLMVTVLFGGPGRGAVPLPLVLGLAVVAVVLFRSRTVRTLEIGWTAPARHPSAASSGPGVTTPVADVPILPASAPRTGGRSAARSLARVEARELVSSPWFAAGVGFWLVLLATLGFVFVDDVNRSWWEFFGLSTMMCHPFAGMAIVAAHRNRTRSRRDGCDEMFDACPADADTRTLGHLITAWIGAVACVLGVVVFAALVAARNPRSYGPIDEEALAALLACAAIGVGAVAFGVTLGRWLRWALVPFAAVVGVALASGQINELGDPGWATDRYLATFIPSPGLDALFFTRPVWARAAWWIALAVLVGALGSVGSRRTRVRDGVAAGALLAVLVAGLFVVKPATGADAARIADRIVDPLAHQTCRPVGPEVRVCAYDDYAELATRTADAVRPVAAAVPPGVLDDVVFLTYFDEEPKDLQAEVRSAIAARVPKLPEHALRIRFYATQDNFDAARMRLGAHAVGLPTETDKDHIGTVVAGQARGVMVLWLATRGLDRDRAAKLVAVREPAGGEPFDDTNRGAAWPASCENEVGVLQWAPKDLSAAGALLKLPAAHVQRVLTDGWARFTTPTTTTDDLLVAVGLAPLGPPERIEARNVSC